MTDFIGTYFLRIFGGQGIVHELCAIDTNKTHPDSLVSGAKGSFIYPC